MLYIYLSLGCCFQKYRLPLGYHERLSFDLVLCPLQLVNHVLGATLFSRKHPLSCWLSSMMMCFAGSFLANFLMGEPILVPFKHHDDILLATVVW